MRSAVTLFNLIFVSADDRGGEQTERVKSNNHQDFVNSGNYNLLAAYDLMHDVLDERAEMWESKNESSRRRIEENDGEAQF